MASVWLGKHIVIIADNPETVQKILFDRLKNILAPILTPKNKATEIRGLIIYAENTPVIAPSAENTMIQPAKIAIHAIFVFSEFLKTIRPTPDAMNDIVAIVRTISPAKKL